MAISAYFGPKTPKGAWASLQQHGARSEAAALCPRLHVFFHRNRPFPTSPHVKPFLAGSHVRVHLDCSPRGPNGSIILRPRRRKAWKLKHRRNRRRERARDRRLFFLFFSPAKEEKKSLLRATKRGKTRVMEKEPPVVELGAFFFALSSARSVSRRRTRRTETRPQPQFYLSPV